MSQPYTFNIPAGAAATSEDGSEVIFMDGEESAPVAGYDARTGTIEFRIYGETYFIHQSALVGFTPGGVNG